ncbi:MAG: hypothetical protein QNJ37_24960 [Crocosphaera sp.]|nr:hypothetical protein [Crocosphaera sp.]
MQNEPQKHKFVDFSNPENLDKVLNSENPLAEKLLTSIIQRENEDAAVERRIKETDAQVKRWKGLIQTSVMYIVGGILILFIGIASYSILTNPKAENDEKSWARTTLTSLATGVIGFLFGKQGSKDT